MSKPRDDYDDMLYGIYSEMVSANDALNKPATPADPMLGGDHLSDTDQNAREAFCHLDAALVMMREVRGRGGRGIDELLITLRMNLEPEEVRAAMGARNHRNVMAALRELGERVGSNYARPAPVPPAPEQRVILRETRRTW